MSDTKPSMEEWIKKVADEISSVDSHLINAVGNEGTVAAQIIRKLLPDLLRTEITRANNELAEKIAGEIEKQVQQFSFYSRAAVVEAAAIARSFIRNEEEI